MNKNKPFENGHFEITVKGNKEERTKEIAFWKAYIDIIGNNENLTIKERLNDIESQGKVKFIKKVGVNDCDGIIGKEN